MEMWGIGDLNSPIAKKIKISPNQRSLFIVYRRDNKIGGKTQLARNYPIATEPFVAYCLTPEKRNVCVWIMRMSKVYLRGENDGVRPEFLIKKRNFCRVMKSLQLAKACVISRWYQIALSREWLQNTLSVCICHLIPLKVCVLVYYAEWKLSPAQVDSPILFWPRDKTSKFKCSPL